jgi:hypothetical protein
MRRFCLAFVLATVIGTLASAGLVPRALAADPYQVLKTAKVGGEGGFDYIFADVKGRRLYIPRGGPAGQLTVFNLDTLESVGAIPKVSAGGTAMDPKSHHGFSTTKPITMWDARTLKVIKTIDVDGRPDGMLFDPFNERVWVLSHMPPHATVIDAKEGTVVGTLDLGGAPEQAASDGKGTVYVNISNKANIAVVDAKNLKVTAHYDVSSRGSGGSKRIGLGREESHPFCLLPPAVTNRGDCERRQREHHYYPADGHGRGYRGVQSRHAGSHQRGRRRHDDVHQGKQSH